MKDEEVMAAATIKPIHSWTNVWTVTMFAV
jgi:hypothetical protein